MQPHFVIATFSSFGKKASQQMRAQYILKSSQCHIKTVPQTIDASVTQQIQFLVPPYINFSRCSQQVILQLLDQQSNTFSEGVCQMNSQFQDYQVEFQDKSSIKISVAYQNERLPELISVYQIAPPIISLGQIQLPFSKELKPKYQLKFETTQYQHICELQENKNMELEANHNILLDEGEQAIKLVLQILLDSCEVDVAELHVQALQTLTTQTMVNIFADNLIIPPLLCQIIDVIHQEQKFVLENEIKPKLLQQISDLKHKILNQRILNAICRADVQIINQFPIQQLKQLQKLVINEQVDSKQYFNVIINRFNFQLLFTFVQYKATTKTIEQQKTFFHECRKMGFYENSYLSQFVKNNSNDKLTSLYILPLSYPDPVIFIVSIKNTVPSSWSGPFTQNRLNLSIQQFPAVSVARAVLNYQNQFNDNIQHNQPYTALNFQACRVRANYEDSLFFSLYQPKLNKVVYKFAVPVSKLPVCARDCELLNTDFVVQVKDCFVAFCSKKLIKEEHINALGNQNIRYSQLNLQASQDETIDEEIDINQNNQQKDVQKPQEISNISDISSKITHGKLQQAHQSLAQLQKPEKPQEKIEILSGRYIKTEIRDINLNEQLKTAKQPKFIGNNDLQLQKPSVYNQTAIQQSASDIKSDDLIYRQSNVNDKTNQLLQQPSNNSNIKQDIEKVKLLENNTSDLFVQINNKSQNYKSKQQSNNNNLQVIARKQRGVEKTAFNAISNDQLYEVRKRMEVPRFD